MLPIGGVYDAQSLEEAPHRVLSGPADGIHLLRCVTVDRVQTRRRKVISHVLAAAPTTADAVEELVGRDARATVRVRPALQLLDQVRPTARTRVLVGRQALAIGGPPASKRASWRPNCPADLTD
ncbi:hypothetical protein [Streptomyces sp. NPDC053069]|uniref:hypothetical protein n=1 Tax=Streptomyces sp. NPDC053069 TaxID=3365695 RepID=UPI0037D24880